MAHAPPRHPHPQCAPLPAGGRGAGGQPGLSHIIIIIIITIIVIIIIIILLLLVLFIIIIIIISIIHQILIFVDL